MDATRLKVAKFRAAVKDIMPYMTGYTYGMIAIEEPRVGTMAVDAQGRLYYAPKFVEQCSLQQGRYTVLHEVLHVVLGHAKIAAKYIGDRPNATQRKAWNWAADCVVNEILRAYRHEAPSGEVIGNGEIVTCETLGLPRGKTVVEYYQMLLEQEQEKRDQNQRGDGADSDDGKEDDDDEDEAEEDDMDGADEDGDHDSDSERRPERDRRGSEASDGDVGEDGAEESSEDSGQPEDGGDADDDSDRRPSDGRGRGDLPGDDSEEAGEDGSGSGSDEDEAEGGSDGSWSDAGGSGADGLPRGYEQAPDKAHRDREYSLTSDLERAVEEQESKAPGSVPGEIKAAVGVTLRPQPDPFDVLRGAVARAVATPVGAPDFTLRKLSRRQQADGPRLRGIKTETPNAVVILDTSGSMSGERVTRAMDVIAKAVRRLKSVRVVCYDSAMHSKRMVSSLGAFEWQGGGGTDMGRAIEDAEKEYRPDAIVLVTDLETPWPQRKPRARVVVAAVDARPHWVERVPAWARLVDLTKGGAR